MAKSKAAPVRTAESPTAEGYTVLARRYRPQQFADLVGQEAVAQALTNALESGRVAHAYLFTGARGVGKTSTARILAKALNCVQGPTATPCDACDICKAVATGEDVDVIEIDAASNRGIDDVREIRQAVRSRSSRSRYKVYIVDEVHMLSKEAFNALLKTLEEPPPHVKFILATTEVQKIPITILSRCQRFDFLGISLPRIVERLREVVAAEGLKADDKALEVVARRAGGSMRDAQSLLDQLLAFGGEKLTVEVLHQMLGTADDDRVAALARAVLEQDAQRVLDLVSQAAGEGLQLGEVLDQLIDYWRDLMVVHCAGAQARDLSLPPRHREILAQQAAGLKLDTILAGLDILATTKSRLRTTSHPRILLEMALVRLGRLDQLVSLSQLSQLLRSAPEAGAAAPRNSTAPTVRPPEAAWDGAKKKDLSQTEAAAPAGLLPLTEATLEQVWPEVLRQVGRFLASDLEKAGIPAISGPNTLVLRFGVGYNSQRKHCQEPPSVMRLEETLKKVTGQLWTVRIDSGGVDVPEEMSETAPAARENPNPLGRSKQRWLEVVNQVPLIRRAQEVLGAQPVGEIDDLFGVGPESSTGSNAGDIEED